ncbi:hypothetical protein [Micromonospora sp. WMMD980]|uniref:hypothetical protein n=1 Tax=Micromonospora sp. WMMD980 TaxID=3016088 RepID=UPI00241649DF|nr:hypothetical protein [Micromonospora sp. WMMD980]MDG4803410.1 hypothetical protein [Micromonospora sp. WMMD980]
MSGNRLPRGRRVVAHLLSTILAVLLAGCDVANPPGAQPSPTPVDPARVVEDFVRQLEPTAPYRDPTAAERQHTAEAVRLLIDGDDLTRATALLGDVGYAGRVHVDPGTGRTYAMFTTEAGGDRPWGILLVDLSRTPELAIEVPHPNSDLLTEDVGLRLFRAVPGSVLVVAGAHRRAGHDQADAAHNADGLFQVVANRFAAHGLNQIQLHGFAEASLPREEVVISNGQRRSSAPLRRAANALQDANFVTCRAWSADCGQLEGTTNTQADDARRQGSVFIHLEITWAVRRDADRREDLVQALAAVGLSRR